MDLKRLQDGYRIARAVLRHTGMTPYSVDIKPDMVYIQGNFDRQAAKKLSESKRWEADVDDVGYVNFERRGVIITMS